MFITANKTVWGCVGNTVVFPMWCVYVQVKVATKKKLPVSSLVQTKLPITPKKPLPDAVIIDLEKTRASSLALKQEVWDVSPVDGPWQQTVWWLLGGNMPTKFHSPQQHGSLTGACVPTSLRKVIGDGNCLFRCIAYAVYRDEEKHQAVRDAIVQHLPVVWASVFKTAVDAYFSSVPGAPALTSYSTYNLAANEYVDAMDMAVSGTYGGSTEIEVATHLLRTPIFVFNKQCPEDAFGWSFYGRTYVQKGTGSKAIFLQWERGNHFNFITSLQ